MVVLTKNQEEYQRISSLLKNSKIKEVDIKRPEDSISYTCWSIDDLKDYVEENCTNDELLFAFKKISNPLYETIVAAGFDIIDDSTDELKDAISEYRKKREDLLNQLAQYPISNKVDYEKMNNEELERMLNTFSKSFKDYFKEEKSLYRYYLTQRPASIGTQPSGAENITNFDSKQYVDEISKEAYGYVEYSHKLSENQMEDYELVEVIKSTTHD